MLSDNMKAFLDMIAFSEGTLGRGDDGYNILYGGKTFLSYADHPRIYQKFTVGGKEKRTSAAGRYQLLARYFDAYKHQLGLTDFSPASQDAIAIQQIRECKALDDIDVGQFDSAVNKCAHIWASLPGAGYGQHENKIERLRVAYTAHGGSII